LRFNFEITPSESQKTYLFCRRLTKSEDKAKVPERNIGLPSRSHIRIGFWTLEDYFTRNKAARSWFISTYSPFVKPVSISCIEQIKFSPLKYLLE